MPEKLQNEPTEEDTIRKLSKTVLHASEKNRQSLFQKLTIKNAERVAELIREKPIFFENKEGAPRQILLDPELADILPQEFFNDPTDWIESKPNITRGEENRELPTGEFIEELWYAPYDISKVKKFSVGEATHHKDVVSKRIKFDQSEEVVLSKRAYEAGIPTPKVLGEILDKGNAYVLSEYIEGINLYAANDLMRKQGKIFSNNVVPFYETKEERLAKLIQSELPGLDSETSLRFHSLWRQYRDIIFINESSIPIINTIAHDVHFDIPLEEIQKHLLSIGKLYGDDFIAQGLKNTLELFDCADISSLVEKFLTNYEENQQEKMKLFIKKQTDPIIEKLKEFRTKWQHIALESAFNFDTEEEVERLKALCKDKGIDHKDFADRNFVIPWDFKMNKPAKLKKDEPKLYIVDWETKK